ncbi:hypothetical protein B1748_33260 [Paenibacillus sp. MY03]|uniref:NHLP leader peptide family RiPP precursor n=1 Tax=Paenibacillus sp. MY03 TaxID=302980 RepID=UPI000B3C2069|nr:NHLP leader peptide family RiPP precursor [Paenibacillus sp. MY03]OUS68609.1 hypothetical protein B1748_33260 [Paenibacillus sp. MY03]
MIYISERVTILKNEQELRDQIIQKAWEDSEFKKQLLADPKSAIKDAFGIDLPSNINIETLEETDDTYYVVIPQNPANNDQQVAVPMWE